MNQRIPEVLHPLLDNYLALMSQRLPGFLDAFYVVGSIALDEFNAHFSDIDFIALLNHRASRSEIERLHAVHKVIEQNYPQWQLSGSYLPSEDLARFEDEVEPHPYYHDGVLRPQGRFELSSVDAWIWKNRGIAITGPQPQELPFTVDWNRLIANMRENLNTYWHSWTKRPKRIMVLFSDWGIQWAVLGVLRQFYTFRENQITTKRRAGEYALACVPHRWHRVIQEALNIRACHKPSAYRSRVVRTIDAVNFLKYIIQSCN